MPERTLRQVGLVAHPTRDVGQVLDEIASWASRHGVAVGQVPTEGQPRRLADPVEASDCDLLLALGGDGTTLLALHAGAAVSRPVMGIACGSVGALTAVKAADADWALAQVAEGRWTPVAIPALEVGWDRRRRRWRSTISWSSATGRARCWCPSTWTTSSTRAWPVTAWWWPPRSARAPTRWPRAGRCWPRAPRASRSRRWPPTAVRSRRSWPARPAASASTSSRATAASATSSTAARSAIEGHELDIGRRADYAQLVRLGDDEPRLSGLRRRGLILDSPRVLVRDKRAGRSLSQRREIAESGTVETAPRLSHRTVALPALASTDCTLPSSPVARLRTCPGGSGVLVRSASCALRRGGLDRGGAGVRTRAGRAAGGPVCSATFSSGTTFAPVPFVPVSRTQVLRAMPCQF